MISQGRLASVSVIGQVWHTGPGGARLLARLLRAEGLAAAAGGERRGRAAHVARGRAAAAALAFVAALEHLTLHLAVLARRAQPALAVELVRALLTHVGDLHLVEVPARATSGYSGHLESTRTRLRLERPREAMLLLLMPRAKYELEHLRVLVYEYVYVPLLLEERAAVVAHFDLVQRAQVGRLQLELIALRASSIVVVPGQSSAYSILVEYRTLERCVYTRIQPSTD